MSMRMRTAFFLASLGGLVLFALGVLAFADSYQRIARMTEIQQASNALTGTGRRLAFHTHYLVLEREVRHREQWDTLRDELAHVLASRRESLQPYRAEVANIEHYLGILERQLADYLARLVLPRADAGDQRMNLHTMQINLRIVELQSALDEFEKAVRLSAEAELGTSGQGLISKFALLFGLYALAGGMAWWFFYLRMQQPLSALASGIHRIRDGDFRFRPDKVAPDEIGSVVEALNELLDRQQALTGKLARSETQLRATLDNTPNVAIQWYDEAGRVTYWNPASETLFGWKAEETLGKTLDMLIHTPEEAAEFLRVLAEIRTSGSPYGPYEAQIHTRDGRTGWTLSTAFALPMDDRRLGFVCMDVDITDRKLAEQELKRSNAELEQFSYAISHDMRQPLRMISSYLQLLEQGLAGQLDGDKQEYFHFAIDGAQRLDQMLVALLEYSRVGRKGEPPVCVESRALLDEALLFLQPAIAEARAEVKIAGNWPRVCVSRNEMMRLIQNLVDNAVKYRVAGRIPEITVTSETLDNEWHLSVADNGVGILPDQAHRLFQVFQRLHTRAAYQGTGIGLALCRKIVEHHGGHIEAESAGEGQGSTFRVRLPLKREESISTGDNEKAET